jgi:hypothetical protein
MPPRHHYWTIILEGKPTAFRAHAQDELIPTLRQLQARHPDAVLRWFARGRLWESQEQERAAMLARRRPKVSPADERRPRAWRPGGEHKDPRDRFKLPRDEKRRRFAQNLRRDRPAPPGPGDQSPGFDRARQSRSPDRTDRARPDHRAKPPWKRDKDREGDEKARPRPHGRVPSRSPGTRRPGGTKPGGGKPGGGKPGGGGRQ